MKVSPVPFFLLFFSLMNFYSIIFFILFFSAIFCSNRADKVVLTCLREGLVRQYFVVSLSLLSRDCPRSSFKALFRVSPFICRHFSSYLACSFSSPLVCIRLHFKDIKLWLMNKPARTKVYIKCD